MLTRGPLLIKLAHAKRRNMPARRYSILAAFDTVMGSLGDDEQLELLATPRPVSLLRQ